MSQRGTFELLQKGLTEFWPTMSPRSSEPEPRTVIVLSSISFSVPEHVFPLFPAYEERFLFFVLTALRQPGTRVVYVTSQPIHPRLIDYFLGLVPGVDLENVRQRLTFVSLTDPSPKPLTEKVLSRPLVMDRIRREIARTDRAMIFPFNVSPLELELAVRLGVPVYGPDPALDHWGTKTGSRTVFAEEGVAHPIGVEGVSTMDELVSAVEHIRERRPGVRKVVVKLDRAVSGLGNAIVDLETVVDREGVSTAIRNLQPEDREADVASYLAEMQSGGGIVEELISGDEFRSPSVQLRNSPLGEVEIVSTHDQVLGGPSGQMFLGCRFPADPRYVRLISEEAVKVGSRLASEGVIGRYGIDFIVTRDSEGSWRTYAIEINLRNGGTTHPFLTLIALTDGKYHEDPGIFTTPEGDERYYFASDHLEDQSLRRLTPDDVLDLTSEPALRWDPGTLVGPAFHLVSAIAIAGQVGVTAIAETPEAASRTYSGVKRRLLQEASRA